MQKQIKKNIIKEIKYTKIQNETKSLEYRMIIKERM